MLPCLSLLLFAQIQFELSRLPFVLENGATPEKHLAETMPGGLAVFDYDNDGKLDIFFANGAELPAGKKFPNRLFRNLGNFRFEDVTTAAGLGGEGYSMGASAADFDGDGHIDLFVAGLHANRLYRNLGNGKFADVTAHAGIDSSEWGIAGAWFDYDRDGLLDLLVVNYGFIDLAKPRACGSPQRVYCNPRFYPPRPNHLYRNLGGGKFVRTEALYAWPGRGMSAAILDYDQDGWLDAFVTNDGLPNSLFRNLGNGKFEEMGLLAGVALLDHGKPVASMGVDMDEGKLVVTALSGETYPVFAATAPGQFEDKTAATQIGKLSNPYAGWGVVFADFDNDGHRDLFTANSHVDDTLANYKQPNTVFRNLGNGKFEAVDAGLAARVAAHRGAVAADFDGDGRLDVVVSVIGETAELWKNTTTNVGNYVLVPPPPIGATVTVDGVSRLFSPSLGYASSLYASLHFGLGKREKAQEIKVKLPVPPSR
ncbi:MAG: CRTAC1 family protein [Bryobacter sp.]